MTHRCLEGFEQRMRLVSIAHSFLYRRGRDTEIEGWFEEGILDNLLLAILLFIMDHSLSEDGECSLEDITRFLDETLNGLDIHRPYEDVRRLAGYLVRDVLQNKGVSRTYPIATFPDAGNPSAPLSDTGGDDVAPASPSISEFPIRLITDSLIQRDNRTITLYQMTDQGFDFLFRTREIERELQYTLEQLKLRELIRRKNYQSALEQCRFLLQIARQQRRDLQQMQLAIRRNIVELSESEYQDLLSRTYALIGEQYKELLDIRGMEQLSTAHLRQEYEETGSLDPEMQRAMTEVNLIQTRIGQILAEQLALIQDKDEVAANYLGTLREALISGRQRCFSIDDEILRPLQRTGWHSRSAALLAPIFMPRSEKRLNLLLAYGRQQKLGGEAELQDNWEDDDIESDSENETRRMDRQMQMVDMVGRLLSHAADHPDGFRLQSFYLEQMTHLDDEDGIELFLQIILRLYQLGTIDLAGFLASREELVDIAGTEFDLPWCLMRLTRVYPDLLGLKSLRMEKPDECRWTLSYTLPSAGDVLVSSHKRILLNDLLIIAEPLRRATEDGERNLI